MSSQAGTGHPVFSYPVADVAAQPQPQPQQPPLPPFPHQPPHQMPMSYSTPSRYGTQAPPFFRGPTTRDNGNVRMPFRVGLTRGGGYPTHNAARRPPVHPMARGMAAPQPHTPYPVPAWPYRAPNPAPAPPPPQWKPQPVAYQQPQQSEIKGPSMPKGPMPTLASNHPCGNSNCNTNNSSKKAARLLLDAALDIVTTSSVESQAEEKTKEKTKDLMMMKTTGTEAIIRKPSPTPLTPTRKIVCRDMEGKKLVQAVSASPSSVHSGKAELMISNGSNINNNSSNHGDDVVGKAQIPDSPGQAFLSFIDDMSESNGGLAMDENSIARQLGSIDNFNFLPYLEEDNSGLKTASISPPMIPFLSKSPQLSWDMAEDNATGDMDGSTNATSKAAEEPKQDLQLQPKPNPAVAPATVDLTFEGTGSTNASCQSVFRRASNAQSRAGEANNEEKVEPDRDIGRVQRTWSEQSDLGYEREAARQMSRDDLDSKVGEAEATSPREAPQMPPLSHRQIPPPPFPGGNFQRLPQSTQLQPRPGNSAFARPPPFAMPRPNTSGATTKPSFVPAIETSRSFPSHQVYPIRPQNSKERCIPLNNPVPTMPHFGSLPPGQANDQTLPEFSELVNFPSNLRQTRSLPVGMRCCVMCGGVRPTCSRIRSRKNKGMSPGRDMSAMCDDFVTIPTQNKGLCTICDISVWVVKESGCQIKWCKGCKNFRQWASFGEKGFATKCARCRERQREKYALLKDAKMRGQGGNHGKGGSRKGAGRS